jgi:hypothetical protein
MRAEKAEANLGYIGNFPFFIDCLDDITDKVIALTEQIKAG